MGEMLEKELGAEVKLVAGDNGIYDVIVDGREIFSKHKQGRFPESEEILNALK